jgi:hypothetical protein
MPHSWTEYCEKWSSLRWDLFCWMCLEKLSFRTQNKAEEQHSYYFVRRIRQRSNTVIIWYAELDTGATQLLTVASWIIVSRSNKHALSHK